MPWMIYIVLLDDEAQLLETKSKAPPFVLQIYTVECIYILQPPKKEPSFSQRGDPLVCVGAYSTSYPAPRRGNRGSV
ncbi:hypothetical protein PAAG_00877 [Paracoccidioides lutzii Pb01]|uniref:Uncharacterized protein n=1 Tax=Paracoccidioides lutzii (strain ATCC MYA-826 / Pb01) TaxID=502779 RepID=C1GQT2_PARBA|nr:hypothetical protein PAAG_00877 [Paracoccidioides lutzii Pb01]EEH37956.1 hypothetical protein PAAG_00877 [Paracoccidioides lutzii Pb01]